MIAHVMDPDGWAPFVPVQMVALGALIQAAHLGGRLFGRMRLSEVTGQLLGGILVGPWALRTVGLLPASNLLYGHAVESFGFFVFVFVSVVAFSIGEELHLDRLRHVGRTATVICLGQALVTFTLVSAGLHWIGRLPLLESMVIGSVGIVTAPAMTIVVMNRLRIEGRLRNILGSVEVLGDVLGVVLFTLLVQLGEQQVGEETLTSWAAAKGALYPGLKKLFLAHLIGAAIYLMLRVLVGRHRKDLLAGDHVPENQAEGMLRRMLAEHPSPSAQIFLIVVATVSVGAGIAHYLHLPFLATTAFAGFLVANFHSHAIFDSLKINNIAALFNLAFFALVGSTVRFEAFDKRTAAMVLIYVGTRAMGKLGGTWLGCRIMKEDRKIASCLPYLLFPQAAVAAVEAVYAATLLGKPEIAAIILPSIVVFEIGGVLMSDRTLRRWRSWVAGEEAAMHPAKGVLTPAAAIDQLLPLINAESVRLDLNEATKEETIASLVARAAGLAGKTFDREEAIQLIREREKLMPTGMGHGIAIPHCRLLALDEPIVVFGRHHAGVVFGGMDTAPCHLIVLILTGTADPDEHVRLLGSMAHLLGSEETRQALLVAETPEEFLDVIRGAGIGEGIRGRAE